MNKEQLTYTILENGYKIKLDGKDWIEQIGQYSKPMDDTKSFEENCLLQIEDLTKEVESYGVEEKVKNLESTNDTLGSQLSNTLIQVMMLQQQVASLMKTLE